MKLSKDSLFWVQACFRDKNLPPVRSQLCSRDAQFF